MYARCLAISDNFDEDSPVRLCSLWLANFDSDSLATDFRAAISLVPSRKFVFLAHQLSARLAKPSEGSPSPNQVLLQDVVRRMGREHSYHSLFPLFCLRTDPSSHSSRRQSQRVTPSSQMERGSAVADIFAKLLSDPNVGERVRSVEHVCSASLELAKHPIKHIMKSRTTHAARQQPIALSSSLLVRKIRNVRVPVITTSTPLDPTTEYKNCVWIAHYDEYCTTAGGVNLPKIVACYGSDGNKYKQLVSAQTAQTGYILTLNSTRGRGRMICAKMLSWSKCLRW